MTERRKDLNIEPATVPAVWEQVVAACLQKDPAKRPQSATEVARRLQPTSGIPSEPTVAAAPEKSIAVLPFENHLQNPKARLVDLKPFSFDRITFEMGYLDPAGAERLQWAAAEVWNKIESVLAGQDGDYYWAALDNQTKKKLDDEIDPIVRDVIIDPCNPYPKEAQPTAISRESPIPFPQTPSAFHRHARARILPFLLSTRQ